MRNKYMRAALPALACATLAFVFGGCNPRSNHTGFEHQNLNLEDSQVDWIPHTYFRGVNSESFTAYRAPSVTEPNAADGQSHPWPYKHDRPRPVVFARRQPTEVLIACS